MTNLQIEIQIVLKIVFVSLFPGGGLSFCDISAFRVQIKNFEHNGSFLFFLSFRIERPLGAIRSIFQNCKSRYSYKQFLWLKFCKNFSDGKTENGWTTNSRGEKSLYYWNTWNIFFSVWKSDVHCTLTRIWEFLNNSLNFSSNSEQKTNLRLN